MTTDIRGVGRSVSSNFKPDRGAFKFRARVRGICAVSLRAAKNSNSSLPSKHGKCLNLFNPFFLSLGELEVVLVLYRRNSDKPSAIMASTILSEASEAWR